MPTKVVTLTFPVAYLISHRNSHLDHNLSHNNLTIYSTNASRESSQGGSKYKVYFDAWMYIVIGGSCFKSYHFFLFNELLSNENVLVSWHVPLWQLDPLYSIRLSLKVNGSYIAWFFSPCAPENKGFHSTNGAFQWKLQCNRSSNRFFSSVLWWISEGMIIEKKNVGQDLVLYEVNFHFMLTLKVCSHRGQ